MARINNSLTTSCGGGRLLLIVSLAVNTYQIKIIVNGKIAQTLFCAILLIILIFKN